MKLFFLLAVLVFASISTFAQSRSPVTSGIIPPCSHPGSKKVHIFVRNPYKIKAMTTVSSERARVADYVEFQTMEKIYSTDDFPQLLFDSGTTIYGIVTWRKHRGFPFRRGHLEIALEPLFDWLGTPIQMGIRRHGQVREENDEKRRNKPCEKALNGRDCVAGRRDAKVAPIVPAVAAAGATAVGAFADDDDTRFIAATAFFSIAKEVGELLNGTDAEIRKDEIFDLYLNKDSFVCSVPKKTEDKKSEFSGTQVIIVKPWP
jgi:hypothetical protein